MYRKEVNDRSPMRVFEKSMHGGLGRGNVGVVASTPGVGKTALLVQIALDDLMRDRKVLHISHEHAVDHVRSYYDEIFHDLARSSELDGEHGIRVDMERNRLLFSLVGHLETAPVSQRGGHSSIARILETIDFARDVAHFEPDVIIIDGFDFVHATKEAMKVLGALAQERSVELWVSAKTKADLWGDVRPSMPPFSPGKRPTLPPGLDSFYDAVSVMVLLQPEHDVIRLRLLKDHANADVSDLHLRLDPHSLQVIDEDVPPASERSRAPRRFRLYSGGAHGAEAAFGACAERWGVHETNFSFAGHRLLERKRGVVTLTEAELQKGDFSLVYVSKRLNRILSNIPLVRNVLQTIWHQINAANQVFVVGTIQEDGTVRGGTGWGAELARLWKKPLFVFDQNKGAWFRWGGGAWEMTQTPTIKNEAFAGIGTQDINDQGRKAIEELFLLSFGEPSK